MIYIFLADGFEECEAVAPIDILRRAGLDVAVVKISQGSRFSDKADKTVVGAHDIYIKADICESEVELEKISMIVLPGGGTGVENLYNSPVIEKVVSYCVKNNIHIGAICAAPSILARWGYLEGRTATAYPSFRYYLEDNEAEISDKKVVTDGIFTTAEAAGSAVDFALELITVAKGKDISEEIARQIIY